MSTTIIPPLPFSVSTRADLSTTRARTANGVAVQTTGCKTAGDGGGDTYIYRNSGRTGVTLNGFHVAGPGLDDYFESTNKLEANAIAWDCDPTGVADCSDELVAATAALPTGGSIVFPAGIYLFTADCTLAHCVFRPGAVLKTSGAGVDVTIDSYTASKTQQVFDVGDGGRIIITNKHPVTVENWGAVGDGTTDDTIPGQAAINATNNVEFLPKHYRASWVVNPNSGSVSLYGNRTIISAANANEFAMQIKGSYPTGVNRISEIEFYGSPAKDRHGLYVNCGSGLFVDNCWFSYCDVGLCNNVAIDVTYSVTWFRNNRIGAYCTSRNNPTDTLSFVSPSGQTVTITDDGLNVGHPSEVMFIAPKFNLNDIALIVDDPGNEWTAGRDFILLKPLIQHCKVGLLLLQGPAGRDNTYFVVNNAWCEGTSVLNTIAFDGVTYNSCDLYCEGGQVLIQGGFFFSIRGRLGAHIRLENTIYDESASSDFALIDMQDTSSVTAGIITAEGRLPFRAQAVKPTRPGKGCLFEINPIAGLSYGHSDDPNVVFAKSCREDDLPTSFYGGTSLGLIEDGPTETKQSLGFAATAGNGVILTHPNTVDTDYVIKFAVKAYCPIRTFTVNAETDVCTSVGHGFVDNMEVRLFTTTTLPAGLSLATSYFVRDKTDDTFKLSATVGGTAIDITTTVTGTHTIQQLTEFDLRTNAIDTGSIIGAVPFPVDQTWKTWCITGLTPSAVTNASIFIGGSTTTVVRAFLIAHILVVKADNFADTLKRIESTQFPSLLDGPTPGPSAFARGNHTGTQGSATVADFGLSVWELLGQTDYAALLLTARSLLNGDANNDGTADANDLIGTYNGTWGGVADYGLPPVYIGKSFVMDGTNYITQVTAAGAIPGNVTIAAWVKCNTLAGRIVSKRNDTDSPFELFINSDGSLSFFDGTLSTSNSGLISTGTWHHVALTLRPGDFRGNFWVDGVSGGAEFIYTPDTNSELVNWGRLPGFGGLDYLDGELYQCAIWNSLLTAEQIELLYSVNLAQPVTTTTIALADIASTINTTKKYAGKMAFNATTGKPVWAVGATAAGLWVDGTGATAHTPV